MGDKDKDEDEDKDKDKDKDEDGCFHLWLQDPLLEGNDGEDMGAGVGAEEEEEEEEEVEAEDKESSSSSVSFSLPANALALLVTNLICCELVPRCLHRGKLAAPVFARGILQIIPGVHDPYSPKFLGNKKPPSPLTPDASKASFLQVLQMPPTVKPFAL